MTRPRARHAGPVDSTNRLATTIVLVAHLRALSRSRQGAARARRILHRRRGGPTAAMPALLIVDQEAGR
jgi:hypothetical protein